MEPFLHLGPLISPTLRTVAAKAPSDSAQSHPFSTRPIPGHDLLAPQQSHDLQTTCLSILAHTPTAACCPTAVTPGTSSVVEHGCHVHAVEPMGCRQHSQEGTGRKGHGLRKWSSPLPLTSPRPPGCAMCPAQGNVPKGAALPGKVCLGREEASFKISLIKIMMVHLAFPSPLGS